MRATGAVVALFVVVACTGTDPDIGPNGGVENRAVQCNDTVCARGQVCCLVFGSSSVEKAECKAEGDCTTGALVCTGKNDCPTGEICCVKTRGGSVQYGPSYCAKECSTGSTDVQLCKESSECTSGSCVPPQQSTTPTNLKQCQK